jgi:putative transposase
LAQGRGLKVRLEADKVCLLVIIGVRADGRKELIALADGFRESSQSWADLLRDAKRRGMRAPVLAVGDGALGFWKAVRDVFPETAEQRCWWHKIGNVLAALPKSVQAAARKAMAEIYNAEDKTHALTAAKSFEREFGTNPIESTFATVRLRQRVTKGTRQPGRRRGDGVHAHRVSSDPMADGQRTPPGRPRPGRCHLRQRPARRTTRRPGLDYSSDEDLESVGSASGVGS